MNEKLNPERTGVDQAVLEKRYATARNIAIFLFALFSLCYVVVVGSILTGLFGDISSSEAGVIIGIALFCGFLGIISGWIGIFFAARALYFRSKLHLGATDNLSDAILAMVVKRIGKHIPAGLVNNQADSQEPQRASADELAELRRELKELRREREKGNVKTSSEE